MTNSITNNVLFKEIKTDLVKKYGVLVNGKSLYEALGYPTGNAFNQSLKRGKVSVPVFKISNRKGYFALTKDIAAWITNESTNNAYSASE